LTYVAFGSTRLGVIIGRDIQNSFDFNQPYYLQTGFTASIGQQIYGPLDVQGRIGNQRLEYRDRAGSVAVTDQEDKVRSYSMASGIDSGICDSGSTSTGNLRSMIAGTTFEIWHDAHLRPIATAAAPAGHALFPSPTFRRPQPGMVVVQPVRDIQRARAVNLHLRGWSNQVSVWTPFPLRPYVTMSFLVAAARHIRPRDME
jgi:hypothetical protein